MLGYENYLRGLYDKRKSTRANNLLREYGCHLFIDNISREIEEILDSGTVMSSECLFDYVCDSIYNKIAINLPSYDSNTIRETIQKVNLKQARTCPETIRFPDHDNFKYNGKRYESQAIESLMNSTVNDTTPSTSGYEYDYISEKINFNKDITSRSITIYYRQYSTYPTYDTDAYVGVDIFHMCVMIYTARRMIKDCKSLTINDVKLVPRYKGTIPEFIQTKFPGCVKDVTGKDFLEATCVYTNTYHFFGGQIPDGFASTVPVICDTIKKGQPTYAAMFPHIHLPFCYIPGLIFRNGSFVPVGYDYDSEVNTPRGPVGYCDLIDLMSSTKNNSLYSIIKHFITSILELDTINTREIDVRQFK